MTHYESPSTRSIRDLDVDHSSSGVINARLSTRSGIHARLHDLAVGRSYFDIRPRAAVASPTSTLVADLSQNFHLGASPAVPTPRRSLMRQFSYSSADTFGHSLEPTTPGEEASLSHGELMDTSPVPSVPRKVLARTTSMFEPQHIKATDQRVVPQAFLTNQQLQRPALLNRKAFSSYNVPVIPEKKTTTFGTSSSSSNHDKENDLADQFADSPKKTPRKFFGLGMTFNRRADLSSPMGPDESERSPLAPVTNNATTRRPVPTFRRTQSMVTKNEDFLTPTLMSHQRTPDLCHRRTTGQLTSPMSPEQTAQDCQLLPSFESRADHLRRISGETFAGVLDGHYSSSYDSLVIVDCRFPHEFEGGHIPNAINISTLDALDNHPLLRAPNSTRTLIILHCEHSEHRAPRIALHLRNRDRILNSHRYPKLFYPELYVLDGGYQKFHKEFRSYLGDSGYVAMNDPTYKPCASRQMHMFRKNNKFQRTQSYTFGQDSPSMGGEPMKRETSFRLADFDLDVRTSTKFAHATCSIEPSTTMESEEMIEDSSMMDIDSSPIAEVKASQSSQDIFARRTHGRSSSGRFYPGRMSSF